MTRSLLFAGAFAVVLFILPFSFLAAQGSGSCPFTFEPEYLGEGNCFRVILRNNDPQQAPSLVSFTILNQGVLMAGDVEPFTTHRREGAGRWRFTDFKPLEFGDADTGYFCLIASTPAARISVAWENDFSDVLCRDTLTLELPQINDGCMEITGLNMWCAFPNARRDDPKDGETLPAANDENFLPIMFYLNLKNHADRGLGSVAMTGIRCSFPEEPMEAWRSPATPIPSGEEFGIDLYSYGSGPPYDSICFVAAWPGGWKINHYGILFRDSLGNELCTDSIAVLISEFDCTLGDVVESSGGRGSAADLRITGLESGEGIVTFTLHERSSLRLWLVDMNGNEVATLLESQSLEAGNHEAVLKADRLPSGTYLCMAQIGAWREGRLVRIVR